MGWVDELVLSFLAIAQLTRRASTTNETPKLLAPTILPIVKVYWFKYNIFGVSFFVIMHVKQKMLTWIFHFVIGFGIRIGIGFLLSSK